MINICCVHPLYRKTGVDYTYSQNSVAGVVAFAVQFDEAFVLSNSTQDSKEKQEEMF